MGTKPYILEAERARRGFAPQDPELDSELRALQKPSTSATFLALTQDWGLIFLAAVVSWTTFKTLGLTVGAVAVYLVSCFVIGSRQKGLENIMHEGTHLNLSPDPVGNDRIALLCVGMWMTPGWTPALERPGHLGAHHENFGNRERDFEFFGYQKLGLGQLPLRSLRHSSWILFYTFLRTTWWRIHGILHSFGLVQALVIAAGVTILLLTGLFVPVLIYWLVPYVFIYMPMRFVAEVSEHMALGYSSEFETTRNKLGWFQEYVMHPHGDGYHLVHHLYPRIPHQNLARAHRLLLQDPVYQLQGHHSYGLILSRRKPTTLSDLLVSGRPSI
jgi:fatty acid desaturase